ncbi:MAG TPA: protein kinase [Vicinamibacteria bacterium]|nr:protein kinase [Vicinamibacteria bacterium]
MNCPSCRAQNESSARVCFACGEAMDAGLAALSEGALFASRYEILGPLGRGGMGMVYRAFDRELGETVAIKVLRPDVARESGRVEQRFRSEIRLARRVRHRNVCSVYGDGEDRGLLYICMELVEGQNLAAVARDAGGLPHDEAWSVALQVADGLVAIHEAGVVHRDLKTANLMRDRKGAVRVMDFGIAKQHGATGGVTVTATGSLMGTPEYMSPEQLRGDGVDFRGDLYSLGVVIFELFTGALPFRGETAVATILRQLHDAPFLDLPQLPEPLRPVLARTLAKDPADRYPTAVEMRRALQAACARSAPGLLAAPGMSLTESGPEDETRPVALVAERPPIARMALAQAALAVLAVHLVSAGGVAAPPLPAPSPSSGPPAATPTPTPPVVVALSVVPSRPRGAASAAPVVAALPLPTPLPTAPVALPTRALRPVQQAPTLPVDPKIYDEDDVDVPPIRLSGANAAYPDWGPRLARGARVSITASFVVNEAGDVTDIRVEEGGGVLEAVLLEISRWKYEPGRKAGRPVKVRVSGKHTFIGG